MLKIWDADNFRRTVAGLCLIAAPLAMLASEVSLHLVSPENPLDTGRQLSIIAENPGTWQLAVLLGLLAAILFVPAVLGMIHLLRGRGVVLGHIGGGLALIGALGYAGHQALLSAFGEVAKAGTAIGLDLGLMVKITERMEDSIVGAIIVLLMWLLGLLLGLIAFFLLFYLFPDGQFVPRWTRFVAVAFIVSTALAMFFPGSLVDIENWPPPFNILGTVEIAFFFGTMIYGQIHRYRRVSGAVERQQTKWVVAALVVTIVCLVGTGTLSELPVSNQPGIPAALFALSSFIGYSVAFMLVPVAIGISVLHYRLWDIDLIINRTLVYGTLTACVVGIYVLVVGYLGVLFRAEGNLLLSLVATGVVAVLFVPLRNRLQRAVNRLMYGERDDPYAVISRLGERLEATLDPRAVLPTVARTVCEALKLPYAAVSLGEGEESAVAAEAGSPVEAPVRMPLVYGGEKVGELLLGARVGEEDFSPADRRLLNDLTRQAGVAVHAVRLTNDLQRSREILVTAREEERPRLRRDLHDGLGPTLGSLPLKLDVAGDLLESDPAAARELLRGLKTQARSAVADIRRLVYELRPPTLDELGLVGAIREAAAQHGANGLPVSVEAPETLQPLPAAVEVAVYRIGRGPRVPAQGRG